MVNCGRVVRDSAVVIIETNRKPPSFFWMLPLLTCLQPPLPKMGIPNAPNEWWCLLPNYFGPWWFLNCKEPGYKSSALPFLPCFHLLPYLFCGKKNLNFNKTVLPASDKKWAVFQKLETDTKTVFLLQYIYWDRSFWSRCCYSTGCIMSSCCGCSWCMCVCVWRLKRQKESERVEIEQSLCPRTAGAVTLEQSQSFDDDELERSVQTCRDVQLRQLKRRETERSVACHTSSLSHSLHLRSLMLLMQIK